VVARKSSLHHADLLESLLGRSIENQLLLSSSDSENARLRRVDDGGERVDTHHTEVRDGERSTLVFLRLELAIASPSSELLGLSRDGSESLASSIGDNRSDETGRSGDSNANVLSRVSEKAKSEGQFRPKPKEQSCSVLKGNSLPDELSVPSRVGFGNVLKSESGSLDDEVVDRKLDTSLDSVLRGTGSIS
jgi:hypothetical protein